MSSKNYLDIWIEPLFRHLLCNRFLFVLVFFFKFEWSTIIVMVRKINKITIIISSWFIPIVLPKTSWCLQISTLYSIKFSKGITTSVIWASSICVLFISVVQSVKRTQFFNITFLLVLFTAAPATAVLGTVIVPLTNMYASL